MPKHPRYIDSGVSDRFHHWLFFEATRRGIAPDSAYGSKSGFPELRRGEKTRLLAQMGFDAPQQFYRYLNPDGPVPTKATLRKICETLDISWPAAALMAGHIDEFFAIAEALCAEGEEWCSEDDLPYASGWGVYYNQEKRPTLDERRYILLQRHDWDRNHAASIMQRFCAIPNPTAVAITLLRANFPPPWHTPRPQGSYWQDVLRAAQPMISATEHKLKQTRGRKRIHPLLKSAFAVLGDPHVRRRAHWIAAEYVGEWTYSVSQAYAKYVENMLFARPYESETEQVPGLRLLPTPEELVRGMKVPA